MSAAGAAALLLLSLAGNSVSGTAGCRYFWMVRDDLETAASIDSMVDLAVSCGANGLVAQVVGRGESYYESDILPEATFQQGLDPLAYLIARARPAGLEVHAWVNAYLVWSAPLPPRDTAHVWHAHPDWFMTDREGRSTRSYTDAELDAAGIVGATLSPALPEVRAWLADIASEIAGGYAVDGIHLDYIRYPGPSFGFEPEATGAFQMDTGLDPTPLARGYGMTEVLQEAWREWRTEQVTLTVETVRSALRAEAPGMPLSCAVMADPDEALSVWCCDWGGWLEEGLVDFVCTMAYTTSSERAVELAEEGTETGGERVVHGIGVFNQPVSSALVGAEAALGLGAGGVCVFSIGSMPREDARLLRELWEGGGRPSRPMGYSVFSRPAPRPEGGE